MAPSLLLAHRFNRSLAALEDQYLREVQAIYDDARGELTGGFQSGERLAVNALIDRTFREMGSEIAALGRTYGSQIDALAAEYARQQLEQIDGAPGFPAINASTFSRRADLLRASLEQPPDWVAITAMRMKSELRRLWMDDADMSATFGRLFAEEITDGRASIWRLGRSSAELEGQRTFWSAGMTLLASFYAGAVAAGLDGMLRTAVAVVDQRTTDCCRQVNGQVVGMNEPFTLTGSPRFSDQMLNPPFHWNCRTGVALDRPTL